MSLNLNNVLIGSNNPDALAAFYTRVFGEPMWRGGQWVAWQAGEGFLTVGPHTDVTAPSEQHGRVVIGFVTDDVHGGFERMRSAGAVVVRPPFHPADDPDGWLAFLADPDGNHVQLMRPTRGPGST